MQGKQWEHPAKAESKPSYQQKPYSSSGITIWNTTAVDIDYFLFKTRKNRCRFYIYGGHHSSISHLTLRFVILDKENQLSKENANFFKVHQYLPLYHWGFFADLPPIQNKLDTSNLKSIEVQLIYWSQDYKTGLLSVQPHQQKRIKGNEMSISILPSIHCIPSPLC